MKFLSGIKNIWATLVAVFNFSSKIKGNPISNKRISKRSYGRMNESAVAKWEKSKKRIGFMQKLGDMWTEFRRKKGPRDAKNFIGTRRMKPGMHLWKLDTRIKEDGMRFFVPEKIPFVHDRIEAKVLTKDEKGVAKVTLNNKVMSVNMEEGCHYVVARNMKNAVRKFARMMLPVQDDKGQTYFVSRNNNGHFAVKPVILDKKVIDALYNKPVDPANLEGDQSPS